MYNSNKAILTLFDIEDTINEVRKNRRYFKDTVDDDYDRGHRDGWDAACREVFEALLERENSKK